VKADRIRTVADFNDLGLMLQAVEQNLGICLAREIMTIDALADGKLTCLSDVSIPPEDDSGYYFAYPTEFSDWPPLIALRQWLTEEINLSVKRLPLGPRSSTRPPHSP